MEVTNGRLQRLMDWVQPRQITSRSPLLSTAQVICFSMAVSKSLEQRVSALPKTGFCLRNMRQLSVHWLQIRSAAAFVNRQKHSKEIVPSVWVNGAVTTGAVCCARK